MYLYFYDIDSPWILIEVNQQLRRISRPDHQPAYSELLENALDDVSTYSESHLPRKRLWEGYYDRVFLVDRSKQWVERAAGHRFPDKLALASGLYDFAHWQLSDWHMMMLDQMYEADADAQLRDDITRQPSTVDVKGHANAQPVQSRGNMPELSGQSLRHLSPQQNPYAQAMQDLRNEPGSFVKFEPEQQSDALSSPEKQRAHFRDSLLNDDETAWARMQRRKAVFRAVLAFNGLLVLLLFLFLGRITEYW